MWERYKNTFVAMQIVILAITVMVFFVTGRQPVAAALFFAVMQVGNLVGAVWGNRISKKIERDRGVVPALKTR